MKKDIVMIFCLLCIFTTIRAEDAQREIATPRQYLSGRHVEDTVLWDFMIDSGRKAGEWSTIPVPSNWELQGFGIYTYMNPAVGNKTQQSDKSTGHYKTRFTIQPGHQAERVLLVFDGSGTDTKVVINGKQAGPIHQGGFFRFQYDVTDLVHFDRENELDVWVSKVSENAAIAKAEVGDYWVFGGIYRSVYLKFVPQQYIDWFAVDATMNKDFKLQAYLEDIQTADTLRATISTLEGKTVGSPMTVAIGKGQTRVEISSQGNPIPGVELWSNEHPNLYRVTVELLSKGNVVDVETSRFGFRTFEVRPGKGFFLNNNRVILKGAARHCFYPTTGRGVAPVHNREDVMLMKYTLNMNFVRCTSYPPDENFLELCDELGLLVSSELTGWSSPLPTEPGKKLVKEMVVKDVNHPSVIIWINANHGGYNPELHDVFHEWDPQHRPIVWNDAKAAKKIPGLEKMGKYAIDARYYPDYTEFTARLAGSTHVVFPGETQHALYDGGGAASLRDYYEALRKSPVGGGLVIWALLDEAVVRTDKGGVLDSAGGAAPDGIVGPYRELEGSAHAAREIFSPVQIKVGPLSPSFDGEVQIRNDYSDTSLSELTFKWELLSFSSPADSSATTAIRQHGELNGPVIKPGESGILRIPLPLNWQEADALRLTAIQPGDHVVLSWNFPIKTREDWIARAFVKTGNVRWLNKAQLEIGAGDTIFTFDPETGLLVHVRNGNKSLPKLNGPRFIWSRSGADRAVMSLEDKDDVFLDPQRRSIKSDEKVWIDCARNPVNRSVTAREIDGTIQIAAKDANGDGFVWTVQPGGILRLTYLFNLDEGRYGYAGLAFNLDPDGIRRKTWLGSGPYRVWKNRQTYADFGLWENTYNDGIPGQVWDLPAFKGVFRNVYWMNLNTTEGNLVMGCPDADRYVGVMTPKNGANPQNCLFSYPDGEGLYLFHKISPAGAKWRGSIDSGPEGQPNLLEKSTMEGTLYFSFDPV